MNASLHTAWAVDSELWQNRTAAYALPRSLTRECVMRSFVNSDTDYTPEALAMLKRVLGSGSADLSTQLQARETFFHAVRSARRRTQRPVHDLPVSLNPEPLKLEP